jgi:hypothetical protein
MNTYAPVSKPKLSQIFGNFEDVNFEAEASLNSVRKAAGGAVEDIVSLFTENIAGINSESKEDKDAQISKTGSLEFKQAISQAQYERAFYQSVKEEITRVENARDRMIFEEELMFIGENISTQEKNSMLHYQADYKDKSIYQLGELRKKIIEQKKMREKEKKQVSMQETKSKASAMNAALEGASGSQGGGQANLSFQAAG